jgi:hypothetical protein
MRIIGLPIDRMTSYSVNFFMDSGAGQCMCSCIEAFSSLQHCAVLIVGVSGNLPVHGIGVANYKNPGAQTATIDDTPLATLAQKKELQSVIGTLLYYS